MQIFFEPKLSEYTTLRLGGKAIAEVRLTELEDVEQLATKLKSLGGEIFVLGAGSNLLASDADLSLILLKPHFTFAPKLLKNERNKTWVQVGAGYRLPKFIAWCAKNSLSGLEGLSGIPGTIGGAIAMNAGSFGTETCPHLESITFYSPSTGIVKAKAEDFAYGYRKFSLDKKFTIEKYFFIIDATFILTQAEMNGIKKKMVQDFFKKKSTQPVNAWSAGCVFKNPAPDKAAGMLIQLCGLKGKKQGGMEFSPVHANFLVNTGKGTSEEAFHLIEEAKEKVHNKFGLVLETEVKILLPK